MILKLMEKKKIFGEISYTQLSNFKIIMLETKNDTYIDDLIVETDYKIPNYFRDIFNDNAEIFATINYDEFTEDSNDKDANEKDKYDDQEINHNNGNNNKKVVFGVVFGILGFIIIIIIVLFVVLKIRRKNQINNEKSIEMFSVN